MTKRYGLRHEDARAWYATVEIKAERFISEGALERVVSALQATGAVPADKQIDYHELIDSRVAELRRDIRSMKLCVVPLLCML